MFKERKIDEITLLENNPRTIKDDSFKSLCKSIQDNPDYFNARPLILSDRTGQLVVIAGNQRYKAAKHLKLDNVPTFLISGLTEEKEKEIVIRDNVSNGEWDFDILKANYESSDLLQWGVELPEFKPLKEVSFNASQEPVFFLNIECKSENHCQELYERFLQEGLNVKIVT